MLKRFDDLLFTTPNDGASTPIDLCSAPEQVEIEVLMEAWFVERQEAVENGLFLKEARALLRQILAEETLSQGARRKTVKWLRALEEAQRARSQTES